MNLRRFESLTRALAEGQAPRRDILQGLAGLALVGGLGPTILGEDAEARKRKKKRKKRKKRGNGDGGGDGDGGGGGGGGNNCPIDSCNDVCVDLDTDPQNCGACGATCDNDEVCIAGRCASAFGERGEGFFQFDAPRGLAFDGTGLPVLVDSNNERIVKLFGGGNGFEEFGGTGDVDGQFLRPRAVAVNLTSGNIYVTDIQRHRLQRFSSRGGFQAAFGSFGTGLEFLNFPNGMAIDQATGNVYVVNTGPSLIKELDADLTPLADFGLSNDPSGFNKPLGIAIDRDRNLVVADSLNNRVVVCDRAGDFIRAIGQAGSGNGQFALPAGVAVNGAGDIFVVDQGNNRIQQFNAAGQFKAVFGREGTVVGEFDAPFGIAIGIVDGEEVIGVADTNNNRVQFFRQASANRSTANRGERDATRRRRSQ